MDNYRQLKQYLLIGLVTGSLACSKLEPQKPNILLIMADEHRGDALRACDEGYHRLDLRHALGGHLDVGLGVCRCGSLGRFC